MKCVTKEPENVPMVVGAVSVVLHAKHVGKVIFVYLYLSIKMCSHSAVVKQRVHCPLLQNNLIN